MPESAQTDNASRNVEKKTAAAGAPFAVGPALFILWQWLKDLGLSPLWVLGSVVVASLLLVLLVFVLWTCTSFFLKRIKARSIRWTVLLLMLAVVGTSAFWCFSAVRQELPQVMYDQATKARKNGDFTEAMSWYRRAADAGNIEAMTDGGALCSKMSTEAGIRITTQQALSAEAFKWTARAAEAGVPTAMLNVGTMYANGRGVAESQDLALRWFHKAADAGEPTAMFNVGCRYEAGRGVTQDLVEAVKWYRKAAEAGEVKAMFNLGNMYAQGRGVPEDDTEAVRWYRAAAEKGDVTSMTFLGIAYSEGVGLARDDAQSVRWFRKAADANDALGMMGLGLMYEAGRGGLARNHAEAKTWAAKSADAGSEEARQWLSQNP